MQFAILIAVLAALASAEGGGNPVSGLAWRLVVVIGAMLLPPLAALLGAQRVAPAHTADRHNDDAVSRLQAIVIGVWLAGVAVVLFVAQWPRIVSSNWALAGWPLVDEVAVLAPVILPLLLAWAALYRLERASQVAACRARQVALPPARMWNYVWMHARHQLGLVLLPPLIVIAAFETLTACGIAAGSLDTAWWVVLPLLLTMLFFMPAAVRRIWRTTPLPAGLLRQSLESICRERKCGVRDILIWHTDHTLANAAVVGVSAWLRYMLLTDVLLARLSPSEVAAVAKHEAGHLRRWHLPLRLALLVLPLAIWLAGKHLWPGADDAVLAAIEFLGLPARAIAALALPVIMLAYAVVVVGWYSRLLEHDADIEACLTSGGQFDLDARDDFCHALIAVCGRARESRLMQWLHPPLSARLTFLDRIASEPAHLRAFRQRLWRIGLVVAALYLATAVIFFV
jgi:STE24 endopeptidase